jgi:peptidoglycan/LPS O-acetylase OafA/YrhL
MRRPALRRAAFWGERLAAFSFTLYVIHVPLLLAIRRHIAPLLPEGRLDPDHAAHFAIYAAITLAIVLMAWLFHLPFEAQTPRLRRWINSFRTSHKRRATVTA